MSFPALPDRTALPVIGEPAPWFAVRSSVNPNFHIDTIAGRYLVLCFFQSAADPASDRIIGDFWQQIDVFDDENACWFGVSVDPHDEAQSRLPHRVPGFRYFWDFDQVVSRKMGAVSLGGEYRRITVVLDERLRVAAVVPFGDAIHEHVRRVMSALASLPRLSPACAASVQAPVLIVPRILEPDLCRALIAFFDEHGGRESGFMRDVGGRTVEVVDYGHKRRRDCEITDERLRNAAMHRVHDRLSPEIWKAFQFQATRIERHIVACYDSESGGHFRPHRDNTTKGTAHRRFAVSLNLNTGEYEGGDLRFPEFGRQTYCAPAGGAVVFSCSLLHEATPIRRGKRYAYLPFLYDDAAARIRQENLHFLAAKAEQAPTNVSSKN